MLLTFRDYPHLAQGLWVRTLNFLLTVPAQDLCLFVYFFFPAEGGIEGAKCVSEMAKSKKK